MSWAESQQVIPVQVELYFAQVGNTVKVRPPRQLDGLPRLRFPPGADLFAV